MTLRLNASGSGYVEIDAPSSAASNTLVLPNGNGSDGNILGTDGSGNLSWVNGRMVLGTSQVSTSGTSIDFTGIPSWVKRVTVMFQGVSTNGTSRLIIQIGAGSFDTSGYLGGVASVNFSTGFSIDDITNAAGVRHGSATLCSIGSNGWVWSSSASRSDTAGIQYAAGGSKSLSGTLDRIRVTTINGTDTFDAGTINILYEG